MTTQPVPARSAQPGKARPDIERTLASLKPFQRRTVEHTFHRLWTDPDAVDRFLVADEVGLGKTLVAKGIAALAVDRLWDLKDGITIVYICSNGQIARQNLQRLRDLTGGDIQDNADRLTLLPATMGRSSEDKVQLISFTPGTSFRLGNSTGTARERALLHWMLAQPTVFGPLEMRRSAWTSYLACSVRLDRFKYRLSWGYSRPPLDQGLVEDFAAYLRTEPGPNGASLREELLENVESWARNTRGRAGRLAHRRNDFVRRLRMAMGHVSVRRLDPDLVILDEFQRFKDLFPAEGSGEDSAPMDEAQKLAQKVITTDGAKVLVLSATPYKMYTLPDEPDSEDHYQDFTRTIGFLAGKDRSRKVENLLRVMRRAVLAGDDDSIDDAKQAKQKIEAELRRVMSRTERLAATPDRSGMLIERSLGQMELTATELKGWITDDAVSQHLAAKDMFEFWRSTPYALNLMDRTAYQIQERLHEAIDDGGPEIAEILREHSDGLLDWDDIEHYRRLDPANAKMRALIGDLMSHDAWKLAWIPPSLEYVQPSGPYASDRVRTFTKRLVFSAWGVVPKAIAVMLSYEAERRALEATGRLSGPEPLTYSDRKATVPLRFGWDHQRDRPRNLANLTLLHPSITLARLGDPLEIAREHDLALPIPREELHWIVRDRIQSKLDSLGIDTSAPPEQTRNWAWYGITPYLLDGAELGTREEFAQRLQAWTQNDPDDPDSDENADGQTSSRPRTAQQLADTIAFAAGAAWSTSMPVRSTEDAPSSFTLEGPAPADLADILATMAVASPGVCALRALSRSSGGATSLSDHDLRGAAFTIAKGMRSLFNRPEIVAAVRAAADEPTDGSADSYWRQVLRYSLDGNLQAVLDEYAHNLVESEGLGGVPIAERASAIAERIAGTASIRTAINTVQDIRSHAESAHSTERHANSHIAARFGRVQTQEQAVEREASVRESFNSPFWPFVLASTSVGQEGLDFHTYSHAVVHWNLPSNPVDLEQREGRVHRYKGHAVRKNVAAVHGAAAVATDEADPWHALFRAAEASRPPGDPQINPYWVFPREGGAAIERYVPAMPLSHEARHHDRLLRTLVAYRLVMGQPRQESLLHYIEESADWMQIDLTPPAPTHAQ